MFLLNGKSIYSFQPGTKDEKTKVSLGKLSLQKPPNPWRLPIILAITAESKAELAWRPPRAGSLRDQFLFNTYIKHCIKHLLNPRKKIYNHRIISKWTF